VCLLFFFFFFNDTATTEIYTLSLQDALPIWAERVELWAGQPARVHDRARWTRALTRAGETYTGGPWRATRLMP